MSPDDGASQALPERPGPLFLIPSEFRERPDGADAELIRELRAGLDRSRSREHWLEERLVQLEAELAAIYGSRFWRASAPARRVLGRIARMRKLLSRRGSAIPPGGSPRRLTAAKAAVLARVDAELDAFLNSTERLLLPCARSPRVSILLVLFNQAALTFACLRAIRNRLRIAAEVVIVDNASSDRTAALLERLDGVRIIRNPDNRHFVRAVNQAAELATGDALLLLNNDACVREGAVEAAWDTLFEYPDVGAVGGLILLPDGTLQEAGSIIWNDGSCVGYGRGRDPTASEFQFVREVDYVSGVFLLVKQQAFAELGGLDPAFAPAYYEETDFCMRLRASGRRILYEPRAVIDHFEFASAGSSTEPLELQRRHHGLFLERHRAALLAEHFSSDASQLAARMRGQFRGRVLVIEDRVPFPSLGAGYPRAARMLEELVAAGWFVTFYPLVFPDDDWADIRARFPATIEVALGQGEAGLRRFLREREGYYDAILVSRPHNMRCFLEALGRRSADARVIYDAEAIFATRELERLALAGTVVSTARQRALFEEEMRLAGAARTVVAVSERDAERFREHGCSDVRVLGHALVPEPSLPEHAARSDLLFVGALDDDPSPNTDSLLWFASEVMPRLDALIGTEYRLLVAGRCRAERVARLAGPRIRLLGRVEDLAPLYASARLFVAPTRFAAGLPHKVHEAAARGLPVVTRSLLAEQLGWQTGRELLTGDTPEAFASACARAYCDAGLWQRLRDAALAAVAVDCDPATFARQLNRIMGPGLRRAGGGGADPGTSHAGPPSMFEARIGRPVRRLWAGARYLRANGWSATAGRLSSELRNRFGRRDYATWVRLYDTLHARDRAAIAAHIGLLAERPVFSLILRVNEAASPGDLRATLDSVSEQIYPDWELLLVTAGAGANVRAMLGGHAARDKRVKLVTELPDTAAASNAAVSEANGRFLAAIEAGDRLRPHTLYLLALECEADPDVALIYADEDVADGAGRARRDPKFKPDWSAELLSAPDLLGGIVAIRRSAVVAAGAYRDGSRLAGYDLLLRVAETIDPLSVRHVPRVLYHRKAETNAVPGELLRRILGEHVARLGEAAEVQITAGFTRIAYSVADPPLVSVIVPTRDHAALLRRCVAGLLDATDYPRIEVLIVDNDSMDPATHRVLRGLAEDSRVRVLPYPHPFNYAAMNNYAVPQARGEVVALLNNDIAIRHPGWLREMVAHALRPDVGAVGAKLFYADGTIQHAGVVTGMTGIAGHPFRHCAGQADGPHARLKRVQAVSCVTAACMVLRRAVYEAAGGLDEVNLPVSYNDVDFCLRLRARGYRIVWTPHAELDHLESVTRGRDDNPENIERAEREYDYMLRRWGAVLGRDPFYSPNLTLSAEDCGLAFPPRIDAPWRRFAGRAGTAGRAGGV